MRPIEWFSYPHIVFGVRLVLFLAYNTGVSRYNPLHLRGPTDTGIGAYRKTTARVQSAHLFIDWQERQCMSQISEGGSYIGIHTPPAAAVQLEVDAQAVQGPLSS